MNNKSIDSYYTLNINDSFIVNKKNGNVESFTIFGKTYIPIPINKIHDLLDKEGIVRYIYITLRDGIYNGESKLNFYIGQHRTKQHNSIDSYYGSGTEFKYMYKAHPEQFTRYVLHLCDSNEDLNNYEEKIVTKDLLNLKPFCLNLIQGGNKNPWFNIASYKEKNKIKRKIRKTFKKNHKKSLGLYDMRGNIIATFNYNIDCVKYICNELKKIDGKPRKYINISKYVKTQGSSLYGYQIKHFEDDIYPDKIAAVFEKNSFVAYDINMKPLRIFYNIQQLWKELDIHDKETEKLSRQWVYSSTIRNKPTKFIFYKRVSNLTKEEINYALDMTCNSDENTLMDYIVKNNICIYKRNYRVNPVEKHLLTIEEKLDAHGSRSIVMYNLDGEFVKYFDYLMFCAEYILENCKAANIVSIRSNIISCIKGERSYAYGMQFRHYDNKEDYPLKIDPVFTKESINFRKRELKDNINSLSKKEIEHKKNIIEQMKKKYYESVNDTIAMYSMTGNLEKIFNSVSECRDYILKYYYNGIENDNISGLIYSCINGKMKFSIRHQFHRFNSKEECPLKVEPVFETESFVAFTEDNSPIRIFYKIEDLIKELNINEEEIEKFVRHGVHSSIARGKTYKHILFKRTNSMTDDELQKIVDETSESTEHSLLDYIQEHKIAIGIRQYQNIPEEKKPRTVKDMYRDNGSKSVGMYTIDGNLVRVFEYLPECGYYILNELKIAKNKTSIFSNIRLCINGIRPQAYGFQFIHVDNIDEYPNSIHQVHVRNRKKYS